MDQNEKPKPEIKNIPKVEMLFEENVDTFNRLAKEGKAPDLRHTNLSQMDLRKAALRGLDLTGCYMRSCNLRGIDFTGCNMSGVSMQGAQISGALFPEDLDASEIRLSVEVGTRMRHSPLHKETKNLSMMMRGILALLQAETKKNTPPAS